MSKIDELYNLEYGFKGWFSFPIVNAAIPLLILTYLVSNEKDEISFSELLENLELTSGNLLIQLKKLKDVCQSMAQVNNV